MILDKLSTDLCRNTSTARLDKAVLGLHFSDPSNTAAIQI